MFVNEVSESIGGNGCKASEWKKLKSKDLGISNSRIPRPTRNVLNILKKQGKYTLHVCQLFIYLFFCALPFMFMLLPVHSSGIKKKRSISGVAIC